MNTRFTWSGKPGRIACTCILWLSFKPACAEYRALYMCMLFGCNFCLNCCDMRTIFPGDHIRNNVFRFSSNCPGLLFGQSLSLSSIPQSTCPLFESLWLHIVSYTYILPILSSVKIILRIKCLSFSTSFSFINNMNNWNKIKIKAVTSKLVYY